MTEIKLREGETVGDYVSRLEKRLSELEPPETFTIQEWHIGQVYCYLLWRDKDGDDSLPEWSVLLTAYEKRFPEQTKKFARYMGWGEKKTAE